MDTLRREKWIWNMIKLNCNFIYPIKIFFLPSVKISKPQIVQIVHVPQKKLNSLIKNIVYKKISFNF